MFYLNLQLPLDFSNAANKLREVNNDRSFHSGNKVIFGENIHYDDNYSDNSYKLELNSNRETVTDIQTQTTTTGYINNQRLFTGIGHDSIIGLGNATVAINNLQAIAQGESTSADAGSTESTAKAILKATAEATGVRNNRAILTGRGEDKIIGFSDVQSIASTFAEAGAADLSSAFANSESTVVVDVLATGVENVGKIFSGQGRDFVVGVANTSTETEAIAGAFSYALDSDSSSIVEELDNATAESNSVATANNSVNTLGINNLGNIFLNQGNDVIFGLANSQSFNTSVGYSEAVSIAKQTATANANAEAIASTVDNTVGIVNQGLIATGVGHDSVIGIAFNDLQKEKANTDDYSISDLFNNQPGTNAEANANADSYATDTDANTFTSTDVDTSEVIAIGIDNSEGLINTGIGSDRVIGYGSNVGIKGGKIKTGRGNDRVIGYGGKIGVEETAIYLGRGNDYFQAAIGDFDSFTGAIDLAEDQTNSIRNTHVFGGIGNDLFKIGGFDGAVSIDGGIHSDTLKLSGSVDSYEIGVSSCDRSLTIEDSGSILTVTNVETIYFGNSKFSVSDFA